jgi:hypothetical protein
MADLIFVDASGLRKFYISKLFGGRPFWGALEAMLTRTPNPTLSDVEALFLMPAMTTTGSDRDHLAWISIAPPPYFSDMAIKARQREWSCLGSSGCLHYIR